MRDKFWAAIDVALDEIENTSSVDEVIDILNRHFAEEWAHATDGEAFFPGSGGERQLDDALNRGWSIVWSEAPYYYVARDPAGGLLTYIEGDVYRGDRRS